ncbi:TRAP transporter large permease [Salinibacterium sp. dk2585]|uniref:TRAP transporter large permease n=1 Tax=unclassified Salinibacterium TaxID=2632331 RepID=UPI0011C25180|nr:MULTISPECIES: TRAP transporter large permease [unclassified Salinibacterium]QEE62318.1 TRAP transporter large permease [Salinibacterium sp. dk2585]TXK53669.1 TRAP transporter large permease [Salinibacterium sp. dk5596]
MIEASIILLVVFIGLLVSSTPIAVALGFASLIYLFLFTPIPLEQLPDKFINSLNMFPLMAIPFFVLAANLMTKGGLGVRLVNAANAVVGGMRGGLAISMIVTCVFFASISGSSPATVVAVGALMIPAMLRNGYGKDFTVGLAATSGSLGILLPPSITFVVYGIITGQSIGSLFLAGIVPGLIAAAGLIILALVVSRVRKFGAAEELRTMTFSDRMRAIRSAALAAGLPVVILGGIYTGVFSPTESAIVAVMYAAIVSLLIYRDITLKDLPGILLSSAKTSAMIMFIIAAGTVFSFVLTLERIPSDLAKSVLSSDISPFVFLLIVNVLLLAVGLFMETTSAMLILVPILFPIAMQLGIDPIHFGVIVVLNLEIGMMTPPLGLNLFVASGLTGMNILRVAKAALPSVAVLLVTLALVTFVPQLSLMLLGD